jgi:hypothetical protein
MLLSPKVLRKMGKRNLRKKRPDAQVQRNDFSPSKNVDDKNLLQRSSPPKFTYSYKHILLLSEATILPD